MIRLLKTTCIAAAMTALCACASNPGAKNGDPATTDGSATAKTVAGLVWTERAYPTGRRETSAVLVERGVPAEVQSGQRYTYVIRVTNLTPSSISKVTLQDTAPERFEVPEGAPAAAVAQGIATWNIGNLDGNSSITVKGSGLAGSPGEFEQVCRVSWDAALVARTMITLPKLELEKSAADKVVLVDGVTYTYTIVNAGTGTAREVKIEDVLPTGITTSDGQEVVMIDVGALTAGQTRSFTVMCKAAKRGDYSSAARATAFGGLEAATGTVTVSVTMPELSIVSETPERAAIGQKFQHRITVKNTGDGPSRKTVVEATVPPATDFISADSEGRIEGGAVRWHLGTIEAGESKTVTLDLRARIGGEALVNASATGHGSEATSAEPARTELYGIATIDMDVADNADPIEVGQNVTYTIRVTNQGTAPATNLKIRCNLEAGMTYVSATGASGAAEGDAISFEAIPELAPKATIEWQVVIQATKAGEVRFNVQLSSDQFSRPVEESAATRFFE
ncbi:MAG: hypothetical protein V3T86_05475 [Planctomycetota bacterium]